MNAKLFAEIVAMVAVSVVVATLLLGGYRDAEAFGFVGSLVAMFWGLPAIVVTMLHRIVEKTDHGK